jgi:SAM-dependent methyltransferase
MQTDSHKQLWRAPARVEQYRRMQGWIDDGERVLLNAVADEIRGKAVLDLGVGAGRTSWLLRLLTDQYVAVDWSAEMVEACRAAHPGIDVRQGDARDLAGFSDEQFDLVFFSYNSIDNLDHDDRLRVFDEVGRVLAPSGLFVYSTFSKHGPVYLERPALGASRRDDEPAARYALRWIYRATRNARRFRARRSAWQRSAASARDHGPWGTAPLEALDYQLAHFSTVAAERHDLEERDMQVTLLVTDAGEPLDHGEPQCAWFYVAARKVVPK